MSGSQREEPARDRLGRPLHDLRISVTDSCNFRCPYCMPAEIYGNAYRFLEPAEMLSFEEIERLARMLARLGAAKIKITGGEPLLRPWLPDLVSRLASIEGVDDLALITNGARLAKMARRLRQAGLHRVTVSLDSLDEQTFQAMNGRGHRMGPVLEGIAAAEAEGFSPIKLNTVVIRNLNDRQVLDLVQRFRGTGHIVRFIEFMDVGNRNGWRRQQVVPSAETLATIRAVYPLEPVQQGYRGEVASRYRLRDGSGEIGFISSVSQPFCRDCTRLRLSADGRLYTCLFARTGFDLRGPLRRGATDEELASLVRGLWSRRVDRYSEERAGRVEGQPGGAKSGNGSQKVEMYAIGG